MPRISSNLIAAVGAIACGLAAPVAGSAAPRADLSAGPVTNVQVTECLRGPRERSVQFRGSMVQVPGTSRMWLRFGLEEKVGDGSFSPVAAPGLRVWRKSRLGVQRFSYRQGVVDLAPGSAYRARVRYRWYGPRGRVVRRSRRVSLACRQPGLLPNLRVSNLGGQTIGRNSPQVTRYTVEVTNRGRTASEPTTVRLVVDGSTVDTVPVVGLAPGEQARVSVNGPLCTNRAKASVDPSDTEREGSEGDNDRSIACPSGG